MSRALAGTMLAAFGSCAIVLYTSLNGRARARGAAAHWRIGWLIGAPGMLAILGGWLMLASAGPRTSSTVLAIVGLAALVSGAAVYFSSASNVGRWRRPSAYQQGLHTSGIYTYVRHPQALSLCLVAIGGACASGSIPFLLTLPTWVGFWISYTYFEENNELLPAFGDEYRRYMRSTPRLLPWTRGGTEDRE